MWFPGVRAATDQNVGYCPSIVSLWIPPHDAPPVELIPSVSATTCTELEPAYGHNGVAVVTWQEEIFALLLFLAGFPFRWRRSTTAGTPIQWAFWVNLLIQRCFDDTRSRGHLTECGTTYARPPNGLTLPASRCCFMDL